jgi:hypothetical protein
MTTHTRQLQQYTRSTNNNYTQDSLKLATIHTRCVKFSSWYFDIYVNAALLQFYHPRKTKFQVNFMGGCPVAQLSFSLGGGRGVLNRKKSESTNSTPSITEFKNFYIYDSSPVYVFATLRLNKQRTISEFYELMCINFDSKWNYRRLRE